MQETRIKQTPYYTTDDGFFVVLSGSSSANREFAGVGFIIAPWAAHAVYSFKQISSHLAVVKLRTKGGKMSLISAYAPHSGKGFDERQLFFEQLDTAFQRTSVNGLKLVMGDLNSRLHRSFPGEHLIIGDHFFKTSVRRLELGSNRELLLEFCAANSLAIANSFFDLPPEELVTYRNWGVDPMSPVSAQQFGQLDFLLLRQADMPKVRSARGVRTETLATQHFLIEALVDVTIPPREKRREATPRYDAKALQQPEFAKLFRETFEQHCGAIVETTDISQISDIVTKAFKVAERQLPKMPLRRRKPWMSQRTLDIINQRHEARRAGNRAEELRLHLEVKKGAKIDKRRWLLGLAGSGEWQKLRQLRQGTSHSQGRLAGADGELVESNQRADTFAKYLESVQWAVRPATLTELPPIFPELGIPSDPITLKELRKAVRAMAEGKAAGPDAQPVEYWKALLASEGTAALRLLDFCNAVWAGREVPNDWHLHQVALIFKKG